ncbi:unnamed protein product [Microthlaspi erraticum]|uniref:Tf2-1-like SH3-like domain-containing protein n=1 Tax=Microthlaspi erraticum TaxID=1685480 RepID=A0A6D2KI85_9BRAS|nr:unnamed protein product [Microthlaspi erraticum]
MESTRQKQSGRSMSKPEGTLRLKPSSMLNKPTRAERKIFEVGDKVWIHLRKERFPAERKSKLMPRIDGPFEITRRINNNSYQIDLKVNEPDLRTNPFQEGGDDMIMEEVARNLDQEAAGELVAEEQLEPEEALDLTIPTGPSYKVPN